VLFQPNCESPWNIDAARDFQQNPAEYLNKVRRCTIESIEYC
jgi:ubiquitin-protein ligase